MQSFRGLPRVVQWYVFAVVAAGSLAIGSSLSILYREPSPPQWLLLAALTLLSGSFTVRLPSIPATISVSDFFVFTSVLLFGPAPGTITVALDGLIISIWRHRTTGGLYRALFNMAAPALSIFVASNLFFSLSESRPPIQDPAVIAALLIPLIVFSSVYFLLNSWLVAIGVALEQRQSPLAIWKQNFAWLSLNYFGGASIAVLLVVYMREVSWSALGIIIPLWLISYLTFKTAMGRVEDANRHLSEVNALHLSTIETLAMAIDAKDQITHGHIRRVQAYAVGLAKALGVKDHDSIRAIEAASLLHDMGKLAVPEYILNKPGRLTPSEFEKMKLHASVGADILSAIAFPYPVVPIVRHHHECWDGSGYPAGLSGTDIPMGARILSVVDCFDALTSDRPYRPRLSDDDALRILQERRGTMYDPLVIDTFVRVHRSISPPPEGAHSRQALFSITQAGHSVGVETPSSAFDDITASTEEMLTLYDLAQSLTGHTTLSDACDIITKRLKRLVPSALCVFFISDPKTDQLEAIYASGVGEHVVRGLRIPIGKHLSGWVAANRQTIINSDPVLDLGDVARTTKPRLRSCLGSPLVDGDRLVGVLTLYSTEAGAFTDDHKRIIEAVSRQLGVTIASAAEFERSRDGELKDHLTGLPNVEQLKRFVSLDSMYSLILINVEGTRQQAYSTAHSQNSILAGVITNVRAALRVGDVLFRYNDTELVVILRQTDTLTAETIATRIKKALANAHATHNVSTSRVIVGVSSKPSDGHQVEEIISAARSRAILPANEPERGLNRGVH